jgi:hypothetical protein
MRKLFMTTPTILSYQSKRKNDSFIILREPKASHIFAIRREPKSAFTSFADSLATSSGASFYSKQSGNLFLLSFIVIQILFIFCFLISPIEASVSSFLTVEAEGVGITREEALMDARRNAVQQTVGLLSHGVTQIINDKVRENVIQLSRAFIEKYDIQDERHEGERWKLKIMAWIRRENLLNGLQQKTADKSPFDGAGLFVSALTREQQIKEAGEMLIELFSSFPYENYIHTGVGAESLHLKSDKVTLGLRFSFDKERYFESAVPLFAWGLDYIAEAKLKDVPFMWEYKSGNPIIITPPTGLNSLSIYMELMGVKKENRYIDIPGAGDFANIYLLKKNYYFDCYRVPAEAFAELIENLLIAGNRNILTGRVFEEATLRIAFKTSTGHLVQEHIEPLQLYNVMLFTNLAGLKTSPFVKGKSAQLNEQRHALFILPHLGTLGKDANDYLLIESDLASISVKLSP